MARELPDNAILIARNLGPADLLEYDRTKLRGLLLEEGSAASHAAIVARALDIPCVGRLPGLRDRVSEGDPVIVDAETGEAYLRPAHRRGERHPGAHRSAPPAPAPSSPSCATPRPSPATGRRSRS